jgi:hypothetical protein
MNGDMSLRIDFLANGSLFKISPIFEVEKSKDLGDFNDLNDLNDFNDLNGFENWQIISLRTVRMILQGLTICVSWWG